MFESYTRSFSIAFVSKMTVCPVSSLLFDFRSLSISAVPRPLSRYFADDSVVLTFDGINEAHVFESIASQLSSDGYTKTKVKGSQVELSLTIRAHLELKTLTYLLLVLNKIYRKTP